MIESTAGLERLSFIGASVELLLFSTASPTLSSFRKSRPRSFLVALLSCLSTSITISAMNTVRDVVERLRSLHLPASPRGKPGFEGAKPSLDLPMQMGDDASGRVSTTEERLPSGAVRRTTVSVMEDDLIPEGMPRAEPGSAEELGAYVLLFLVFVNAFTERH